MIAKWILIVVIFSGPFDVADADVYFGEGEKQCREAQEIVRARAAARQRDVYAECFDMKRPEPPPGSAPKPNDPKSEVRS